MCITGTSSRDSLVSWIRFLQKSNPNLEQIPVIFTLRTEGQETALVKQSASGPVLVYQTFLYHYYTVPMLYFYIRVPCPTITRYHVVLVYQTSLSHYHSTMLCLYIRLSCITSAITQYRQSRLNKISKHIFFFYFRVV
jgi:hypothetical protein